MDDQDRLTRALADRYGIEREIGSGGMAVVYLAQDKKLSRPVALKVLRPELAESIGADRFLREIQIAARLSHPNILGLFDSGEVDGLLFYTMPFVEGETLRDRMNRERQLPLEDALQITREVADALAHAHEQGLVHRDIKPENILFQSGHAVVADFGIARAVSEAGGAGLTKAGLAVGTPAYMSPEQAAGECDVDHRADLYSLGCVLYEMLGGETPYTGPTPQAVIAKKLSDPTPSITTVREAVPAPVAAALTKALAKDPVDRFRTAEQFTAALEVDTAAFERRQKARRRVGKIAMVAAGVAAFAAIAFGINKYWEATSWKRAELDPNKIAVMPFRVTASDSAVLIMDEGLPDLLYGILSGDMGILATHTGSLLKAIRKLERQGLGEDETASRRVAAQLGAGRSLEGAIVQAGAGVRVNVWLQRVRDGVELARHSFEVQLGALSELPMRLVLELFGDELGEDRERLEMFERHDQGAVMAYLAGVRAYRNGNPGEALVRWKESEGLDSTFALPVLRTASISSDLSLLMPGESTAEAIQRWDRSTRRAWELREALSERDLAEATYYLINIGADTIESSVASLEAAERWATLAEDNPDAQMSHALSLLMAGAISEEPNWEARFRAARERAWALDPESPSMLINQAYYGSFIGGDSAWAERILPAFLANVDSTAERWAGIRWSLAHFLGDSATVRSLRARALAGDPRVVKDMTAAALVMPSGRGFFPYHDAQILHDLLESKSPFLLLPAGRVGEAASFLRSPQIIIEFAYAYPELVESEDARANLCRTFSENQSLRSFVPGFEDDACDPVAAFAEAWLERGRQNPTEFVRLCYGALYRARHGDTIGARDIAKRVLPRYQENHSVGICPAMVEAFVESHDNARMDTPALDRLEELMRTGPGGEWPASTGMLVVVRLARQRGDLERALKAAGDACCWGGAFSRNARAPILKEEAELSVLLGDTARAIKAYEQYLNIRAAPDPGVVQQEVDGVRAELAYLRNDGHGD